MKIFLLTLGIMSLAFGGMALGAIIRGKSIEGSCGGLDKLGGLACWFCPNRDAECFGKKENEDGC